MKALILTVLLAAGCSEGPTGPEAAPEENVIRHRVPPDHVDAPVVRNEDRCIE